jgi:pantoate--beta-alanine ligase
VKPLVVTTVDRLRQAVAQARGSGHTIGLVPTLGALHEGHASLLRAARAETGYVVVSIFVNPTQFGPNEDFTRYPRTLEQDLDLCGRTGVDLAFVPDVSTMYPEGFSTYVQVHGLQDVLCGPSRPGHFRGVATVVLKLFNQVQPDVAYFGQKDAQQARIIQKMVQDLDVPVLLRICPIMRESDGLALSSRNRYLDPVQRRNAVVLYQVLEEVKALVAKGERDARSLRQHMVSRVESTPGATLDYSEIVDAQTLQPVARLERPVLVALAVKFGDTRLIDNAVLRIEEGGRT